MRAYTEFISALLGEDVSSSNLSLSDTGLGAPWAPTSKAKCYTVFNARMVYGDPVQVVVLGLFLYNYIQLVRLGENSYFSRFFTCHGMDEQAPVI